MITLGEIIVTVEANRKAFDDAMMRLYAILNEPHTCPTCGGYGYLVAFRGEEPYSAKRVFRPDEVEELMGLSFWLLRDAKQTDIPCPDCNAE